MRLPKVGEIVEVVWIDSGKDHQGKPGENREPLTVATAYGRVSHAGTTPGLHKKVCTKTCRCVTLELVYDGGEDDDRSSLGLIWWNSVVSVAKLVPKQKNKPA